MGAPLDLATLDVPLESGQTFRAAELSGAPLVLVRVGRWNASVQTEMSIRAQLRGLGSELIVFTPTTVVHLGADDPARQLVRARPLRAGRDADAFDVRLLDPTGQVRWHAHLTPPGEAPELVLGALKTAVESMRRRPWQVSRRDTLVGALIAAFAVTLVQGCATANPPAEVRVPTGPSMPPTLPITLNVNGTAHALQLDPRATLLDTLRETLGLTGAKKGCDHGQCGACTVRVNGVRIDSCLTLAAQVEGKEIVTIEGLAHQGALHPMQRAFIDHDGLQCGYCTPGQILSACAMLDEGPIGDDDALREKMSGNICRCGAYANIVAAIREVADHRAKPVGVKG